MVEDREDFTESTVIKGIYNGELYIITLDSNHNIIAVMKGDYKGTLQTVKLDSEHRMIARSVPSISGLVNDAPNVTADDTSMELYSTVVPAGSYWRINTIFAQNTSGFSGFIRISKWSSSIIYKLLERHDLPDDIGVAWTGELWLGGGMRIQARFYDVSIGDTLRLYLNGTSILIG